MPRRYKATGRPAGRPKGVVENGSFDRLMERVRVVRPSDPIRSYKYVRPEPGLDARWLVTVPAEVFDEDGLLRDRPSQVNWVVTVPAEWFGIEGTMHEVVVTELDMALVMGFQRL